MRKISFYLLLMFCCIANHVNAQLISAANPDFLFPVAGSANASRTHHMSCYDFEYNGGGTAGNFNVYSWSGNDPAAFNNAGIAFTYMDPSNSFVLDRDFIQLDVKELEVGLIEMNNAMHVIAVYESFAGGVFANVYQYNFMGGLTPVLLNVTINSTGSKPRISNYKAACVAIVYETPAGIGISAYTPGMTAISNGFIAGTIGCSIPDVSIMNNGNLDVYVAYYESASLQIKAAHQTFTTVSGGGVMAFIPDDSKLVNMDPVYIDIDCAESLTAASVSMFAYVYDQQNDLFMRLYNAALTPSMVDVMLTNPTVSNDFRPVKPSIAYELMTGLIDVAWSQEMITGIANPTIGLQLDEFGNILTPMPFFLAVSQASPMLSNLHALVALSKNKLTSNEVFCAFSLDNGATAADLFYKFKNLGSTSYRLPQQNHTVNVYPNPFADQLAINVPAISADDQLKVTIVDITGKVVFSKVATIDHINAAMNEQHAAWSAGMYILQVVINGEAAMQQLKLVKQ